MLRWYIDRIGPRGREVPQQLVGLLARILRWDAAERPPPERLLEDPAMRAAAREPLGV